MDCRLGNQPDENQRERTEDDVKASVSSFYKGERGNTCNWTEKRFLNSYTDWD